jgi:hypothetical protein
MLNINPIITTNASGTFSVTLDGLIQGFAMDDPAARNWLTGGILAATETQPMFGGIPITENFPAANNTMRRELQAVVTRAVAPGAAGATPQGMTGISVFNQNWAAINTPQSPVPGIQPGMSVHLYRFGTNARIVMEMDPAMILPGTPFLPLGPLFWNVANQWVTATGPAGAGILQFPNRVQIVDYNIGNSMVIEYNAATGFATWTRNGDAVVLQI